MRRAVGHDAADATPKRVFLHPSFVGVPTDKLINTETRCPAKKSLHSPLLHDVMMQSSSNPSQHSGCSSTFFACQNSLSAGPT
jgi:hypothetical protein